MQAPFFTIVIPCFNSATTLSEALVSILQQQFYDLEILVMDGGSTDGTIDVAKAFNDHRIRICSEPDKGPYDAMNHGLEKSTGEWVYFLGSDDRLYDTKVLLDVHQNLVHTRKMVAYGNVSIEGDVPWAKGSTVYDGRFTLYKLLRRNICHQSIFYRRSLIMRYGLRYSLDYPTSADWDFNIRCWLIDDFKFMNRIIANFSHGGISSSSNANDGFGLAIPKLFEKYWKVPYTHPLSRIMHTIRAYFFNLL